ncbi:hypothetical protein BDR03DRAFT_564981 [Suillus americanus]|nr:hypothetical protein BDR03DRAFT_564981 [Suillus americanus]
MFVWPDSLWASTLVHDNREGTTIFKVCHGWTAWGRLDISGGGRYGGSVATKAKTKGLAGN